MRWVPVTRRHGSAVATLSLLCALVALGACGRDAPEAADAPVAGVDPPLRFALCTGNVDSVAVIPGQPADQVFGVAVQLEKAASEEFARLTAAHVGRVLEIGFGRRLFVRATIRSSIRSGTVVDSSFADRDQAEQAASEVRANLPAGPCGALS